MKVLKHCILKTSVFFTLFLAASVTSNAQNRKIGINTVVIDAGHGGPDAGAVGRLYKEKDINLDVALRFGRMISEHYPDVQVIYTRKTDVLIPLAERGDIANRAKADLFISIHINSNKSSSPSGVSVYVMGVDKASKNMDVAMKENDVITYEEDYSTRYQGYKPGSTESLIMFSLMQYAYQTQSCLLADMVQKQFVGNTQMQDRGEAKEMVIKNLYKYYVGEAASYKEALSLQSEVRRHVKGAFLVPFRGNEPIPMDEARRSER